MDRQTEGRASSRTGWSASPEPAVSALTGDHPSRDAARPVRLQLSRKKGFRLQDHSMAINGLPAVKVARPGLWGNYAAVRSGTTTGQPAVEAFRQWVAEEASDAWKGRAGIDLRGKNLACFCRLDQPCHADVLLEIANGSPEPIASGAERGER